MDDAGQIGQATHDLKSEVIGLGCALLLLLLMFGSIAAAAIPLVSALFSVGAGLSLVGLLAAATTFPTAAPTVATLLGLGVANSGQAADMAVKAPPPPVICIRPPPRWRNSTARAKPGRPG